MAKPKIELRKLKNLKNIMKQDGLTLDYGKKSGLGRIKDVATGSRIKKSNLVLDAINKDVPLPPSMSKDFSDLKDNIQRIKGIKKVNEGYLKDIEKMSNPKATKDKIKSTLDKAFTGNDNPEFIRDTVDSNKQRFKDLGNIKSNLKHNQDILRSVTPEIEKDLRSLQNQRDNEIAKTVGLYAGGSLVGLKGAKKAKSVYDRKKFQSDKQRYQESKNQNQKGDGEMNKISNETYDALVSKLAGETLGTMEKVAFKKKPKTTSSPTGVFQAIKGKGKKGAAIAAGVGAVGAGSLATKAIVDNINKKKNNEEEKVANLIADLELAKEAAEHVYAQAVLEKEAAQVAIEYLGYSVED